MLTLHALRSAREEEVQVSARHKGAQGNPANAEKHRPAHQETSICSLGTHLLSRGMWSNSIALGWFSRFARSHTSTTRRQAPSSGGKHPLCLRCKRRRKITWSTSSRTRKTTCCALLLVSSDRCLCAQQFVRVACEAGYDHAAGRAFSSANQGATHVAACLLGLLVCLCIRVRTLGTLAWRCCFRMRLHLLVLWAMQWRCRIKSRSCCKSAVLTHQFTGNFHAFTTGTTCHAQKREHHKLPRNTNTAHRHQALDQSSSRAQMRNSTQFVRPSAIGMTCCIDSMPTRQHDEAELERAGSLRSTIFVHAEIGVL
jgi:hypothetical protein